MSQRQIWCSYGWLCILPSVPECRSCGLRHAVPSVTVCRRHGRPLFQCFADYLHEQNTIYGVRVGIACRVQCTPHARAVSARLVPLSSIPLPLPVERQEVLLCNRFKTYRHRPNAVLKYFRRGLGLGSSMDSCTPRESSAHKYSGAMRAQCCSRKATRPPP